MQGPPPCYRAEMKERKTLNVAMSPDGRGLSSPPAPEN
ncbi:hypothetical protein ANO14919_015600 [Xylariales sp. No.14919]|nr:hypothetical protein ANO14919_015600 [Xylariales sp. No.14919]